MSREEALDRYNQHVVHCPDCQKVSEQNGVCCMRSYLLCYLYVLTMLAQMTQLPTSRV